MLVGEIKIFLVSLLWQHLMLIVMKLTLQQNYFPNMKD